MDQPLEGKHALVTGGGRGIGRSIALALARAGADVAVAARTREQLDAVAGEIRAIGRRAIAVPIDLSRRDHIEERVKQTADELGGLEILVNNAGGSDCRQSGERSTPINVRPADLRRLPVLQPHPGVLCYPRRAPVPD